MSGAGAASRAPGAPDAVPRANAAAAATVLATGDSMMQILDIYLARRLEPGGKLDVRSDTRISTGISKPSLLNWPRYAASQARRLHPRATVMFLGANDGFNFRSRQGAPGAVLQPRVEPRVRAPRAPHDGLLRPGRIGQGVLAAAAPGARGLLPAGLPRREQGSAARGAPAEGRATDRAEQGLYAARVATASSSATEAGG